MQESFFDFDLGFVVVVQFEDNVGETFEVRVDRSVKGELDVARIEPALLRIVIADFDMIKIARAGVSQGEQSVEGDVHVIFSATDGDRRRQRSASPTT